MLRFFRGANVTRIARAIKAIAGRVDIHGKAGKNGGGKLAHPRASLYSMEYTRNWAPGQPNPSGACQIAEAYCRPIQPRVR